MEITIAITATPTPISTPNIASDRASIGVVDGNILLKIL
jgi:hypothetical protein